MDTANTFPAGTTHVFRDSHRNTVEFYKEIGVSSHGNPTYVRWIKSRNNWAKVDQAFDHVKKYAEKVS